MASTTAARRPWTDRLKDRWPTALALGLSALTFGSCARPTRSGFRRWGWSGSVRSRWSG
jgi:hypothetical protein